MTGAVLGRAGKFRKRRRAGRARRHGGRDERCAERLSDKHGDAVIRGDLLDPKEDRASLVPRILDKAVRLDILHANAGLYVGGSSTPEYFGHGPDAEPQRQRRDEELLLRAAAHGARSGDMTSWPLIF